MQRRLDGFTLNELVGFGATGEVWRARPQTGGADVALKWLDAEAIDIDRLDNSGLRDFRHPHVAQLLDVRQDGSSVVLVHQFITGVSLAALLAERERLSGSEVVTLLTPIAEALDAAHEAGLLHANLTPAAVLVTPDGRPIVTDVGIWRSLRTGSATRPGSTRLEYLDPGVARGSSPSKATDVFGIAAIGYHALTGRPPWSANARTDTWELAAVEQNVDLAPLGGRAGSRLIDVIARGLSDNADRRGSAGEFAADVCEAAEPEPLHLSGPYLWPDLPSSAAEERSEPALADTRTLDITGEVRRGAAARHAAASRVSREPPPDASILGTNLDRLSRFGSAARLVPRRALVSAGVTLAVLAAIVLALGWNASKAVPARAGAPIGPASAAVTGIAERAIPDSPEAWAGLLNLLYERRALAFRTGDASLLDQVFTSDSPLLVADSAELAELAEAGEVLRDFAPRVLGVLDVSVVGDHAALQITDEFGDYETVPALDTRAGPLTEHPGRGPAPVAMTLVLTEQGWRIQTAERLA